MPEFELAYTEIRSYQDRVRGRIGFEEETHNLSVRGGRSCCLRLLASSETVVSEYLQR